MIAAWMLEASIVGLLFAVGAAIEGEHALRGWCRHVHRPYRLGLPRRLWPPPGGRHRFAFPSFVCRRCRSRWSAGWWPRGR